MSEELPEEMDYDLLVDCCATCRFWDFANRNIVPTGGDPDVDSACRRFPPVFLHPTKTPQNNLPQWSARSYAQPWTNDYDWCGEFQPRKPVAEPRNPVLDWDVDSLDLCVRSRMALARDSVKTVQQLVEMSAAQLLRIPKFGQTSLNELRECLAKHTLRLKDDL